jgi:hypothetical protein
MNWKLIFLLSLFGLAMAISTVYFISATSEPAYWAVIFVICAWIIAKKCSSKYFLHGLYIGLFNALWITAAHIILYDAYIINHPEEASMMARMPVEVSQRVLMLVTGPFIGLISGSFLGFFAFIASKIVRKKPVSA